MKHFPGGVRGVAGALVLLAPALSPPAQEPSAGPPFDGKELQGRWPGGAGLAGSATCGACHPDISEAQNAHPMARTASAVTPNNVDTWFSPERLGLPVDWRSAGPLPPRYQRFGGGVILRTPEGDGAPVAAVFGSGLRGVTPVAFPGAGAMRELRVSWSHGRGRWIETPGAEEDRDPLGDLDSAEEARECLSCHATSIEWRSGVPDPARSEWGVRCERCHGPGATHAERLGDPAAIFNPGTLSPARQVAFCGQCHRQPTDFEPLEVLGRERGLARHAGGSLMMSACFREIPAAGDDRLPFLSRPPPPGGCGRGEKPDRLPAVPPGSGRGARVRAGGHRFGLRVLPPAAKGGGVPGRRVHRPLDTGSGDRASGRIARAPFGPQTPGGPLPQRSCRRAAGREKRRGSTSGSGNCSTPRAFVPPRSRRWNGASPSNPAMATS